MCQSLSDKTNERQSKIIREDGQRVRYNLISFSASGCLLWNTFDLEELRYMWRWPQHLSITLYRREIHLKAAVLTSEATFSIVKFHLKYEAT